jgi:polar amino acid transport system substrate-binding protein
VRIGVRNDNPPLSFVTEEGEWVGFDVDLAHAIAAQLNLEPELIVVDGTTRISFLQEGRVDMSIASMNHTRKRDNAIDFSITYFWDNQSFLVRTGEFTAIEKLMGKKVAANAGSSAIPSWIAHSAALGGPEPEIVEFSDKLAAMQALRDGAVEGYTEDNITMLALAAGDPALELLPGGHNPVQFGIGVPNNQSAWRDQVNYALQELWKSGAFHEIYARWFEGPDAAIQLPLGGQMEIWPE